MNETLTLAINASASATPVSSVFAAFAAQWLIIIFVILFLAFSFLIKKQQMNWQETIRIIAIVMTGAVFAWIVAHIIKYFLYVDRPFVILDSIQRLIPHAADSSFPSGHATFVLTLASVLHLYHRQLGIFFFILALMVAWGRVAVGVHWLSDIGGALLLALLTAGLIVYVRRSEYFPRLKKLLEVVKSDTSGTPPTTI